MSRLLLCLCLLLAARPAAGDETVEKELLTVCLNGTIPGFFYRSGNKVFRLDAFATGIGAPLLYKGPAELLLYGKAADLTPRKRGEPIPVPLARVVLPADKRVLLVFAFDAKTGSDRPGVVAHGVSTSLRAGDYRLFNFSTKEVFYILGDKKGVLAPGRQGNLSSASWRSEVQDLLVRVGLDSDGDRRVVYSSAWGHRPQKRNFLFFFDQADRNRPLDIRRYYDVPGIPIPPAVPEAVLPEG
jgi:hypothetical protein